MTDWIYIWSIKPTWNIPAYFSPSLSDVVACSLEISSYAPTISVVISLVFVSTTGLNSPVKTKASNFESSISKVAQSMTSILMNLVFIILSFVGHLIDWVVFLVVKSINFEKGSDLKEKLDKKKYY